jgi:hypothetical protein
MTPAAALRSGWPVLQVDRRHLSAPLRRAIAAAARVYRSTTKGQGAERSSVAAAAASSAAVAAAADSQSGASRSGTVATSAAPTSSSAVLQKAIDSVVQRGHQIITAQQTRTEHFQMAVDGQLTRGTLN